MTIQMLKDKVKSLGLYMLWRVVEGEILIYDLDFNGITFSRWYSDSMRVSEIWKDVKSAYAAHAKNPA